jgi:Matrixin
VRHLAAGIAIFAGLAAGLLPAPMGFHALTASPAGVADPRGGSDEQALKEMFGGSRGPQRWKGAPKLTILVTVMEYRAGGGVEYVAAPERLSDADVTELARDLTDGLSLLTAGAFEEFSSLSLEYVPAGATTRVSRRDHIVAGRFNGLRRSVNNLGFGGRRADKDGTITAGAILLDSEFDSTSAMRRLLRTHELGHALGYNHVHSRGSIMNPRIGTEPNDFDRHAALIAFRAPSIVASR